MNQPVASDTFRDSPYYRRECFHAGLARCGYVVQRAPKDSPDPQDVLLIWNRSSLNDAHARRYDAVGARVIVVENAYIGRDRNGHHLYAIALDQHAGAGRWIEGPTDRWSRLDIELAPWRADGDEIVVLPQRGFGAPGVAMPRTWTEDVVSRLKRLTKRPVRVRPHPGKDKTDPTDDLRHAWAAVTWASGAGIKALASGIPVFHEMPTWVGAGAAVYGINSIEKPFLGDRLPMFRRLAWTQWSLDEISAGEPFKWLLG